MPDKQAREAEAGNDTDSQAEEEAVLSSAERKAGKGRSSQVRQPGSQPYQVRTRLAISPEGPFPTLPAFLLPANQGAKGSTLDQDLSTLH